jgi:hypothetical protein
MATLEQRLRDALSAVGVDVKGLIISRGSLAALTTTDKTSLVAALNELKADVAAVAAGGGAAIDDAATVANKTWSSTKINTSINSAINALLNNAPAAFDTLKELSDQLAADQSALAAITTALSNRLRFDAAQALTAPQIAQGAANLGLGNPDADLAAHYTAAKV